MSWKCARSLPYSGRDVTCVRNRVLLRCTCVLPVRKIRLKSPQTYRIPFKHHFEKLYTSQFGYYPENLTIELESIKLMLRERAAAQEEITLIKEGEKGNSAGFRIDIRSGAYIA